MQRLRRKADIARVFREGRRFSSPAAVLHTRLRAEAEPVPPGPRLTIIAGRRFSGAVARNRARRLLRETARLLLARVAAPWDLLLVARTEVLALPYQLRRRLLSELFCQAGVVAEEVAAA